MVDNILETDDSEAIILRAKLLVMKGKKEEAGELLQLNEQEIDIVGVAYMYLETNLPEEAMIWLRKGKMEKETKDESYLAALGDCLQALKKYDEAIVIVNKLIDLDPYSAHYWYGLAMCYYQQEHFERAMDAVDYAIVSDEEFGNAYALRGDLFQHLGNRDKARENYQKALQLKALNPDFMKFFSLEDLMNESRWEEAALILAVEVNDTSKPNAFRAEAMIQYAFCLTYLERSKEAMEWLEKAIELDEKNASAYVLLGRLYFEKGDELTAVNKWKKALRLEPFDTTWEHIANQCLALQRFDYMELCFEKVKMIRPEDKQVDLILALLNLVLGNDEKFQQYNRVCSHPLSEQQAREYKKLLSRVSEEQLSETFTNILKENVDKEE